MNTNEEITFLTKRVNDLEKQLENLRLSRRVLMDLLEQIEKEKNNLSSQLEKKSKHLQRYRKMNQKRTYSQNFELYEFKNYIKE
ncbi:MAG: hypothetical protein AWM53_00915 [Candidatus Dichloromethanomonas elyunquensis]|nr:MAG: hypothetical protein AWM53_00915 [Candidatus Dichloromethanomonas elyunquensis]